MKVIGFILLIVGGWGISLCLVKDMKQNLLTWSACGDLIRFVRLQIDCFLCPQDRIFDTFTHPLLEQNGLLPALREGRGMEEAVKGMVNEKLQELLLGFGRELGQGYREEQMRVCDFYLAQITEYKDYEAEQLSSKIKIKRTICMAGAMLIGLLLL